MIENYFGLIEATFVFGLAIAFYVWQKRSLDRDNREYAERKRREAQAAEAARGSAAPSGHAEGQHRLDEPGTKPGA